MHQPKLLDRFDALGGGGKPETVREIGNCLDDQAAVAGTVEIGNERLVDLQLGKGQVPSCRIDE